MKYSWVYDPHGMAAGAEVGVKTTSGRLTSGSSSVGPSMASLLPQSRGGLGGGAGTEFGETALQR